jgi:hypothetical protein
VQSCVLIEIRECYSIEHRSQEGSMILQNGGERGFRDHRVRLQQLLDHPSVNGSC